MSVAAGPLPLSGRTAYNDAMLQHFDKLLASLPGHLQALLRTVSAAAAPLDLPVWLVGGVVRDMALGLPVGRDIDVAVEGDPAPLVSALTAQARARVIAQHARFGTATLDLDGFSLDLIRTRRESYHSVAALPTVTPSDITDDLLRRDFSLNAVGLRLILQHGILQAAALADPSGGCADLQGRTLRLLHASSLFDDPTRLLRGVRLAARLDLQVEVHSREWIAQAVSRHLLGSVSNERIVNELCLLLDEPDPAAVLTLADAWGLTEHFSRRPLGGPALQQRLQRFAAAPDTLLPAADAHLIRAGLITVDLDTDDTRDLLARFNLPRPYQRLISQLPALRALLPDLNTALPPSRLDALLQPFETAACAVVHYAAQPDDDAATLLASYLRTLRPRRAPLDGNQLRQLGVSAGPQLGDCLRALRAATLDGDVHDEPTARTWVQHWIRTQSSVPDA